MSIKRCAKWGEETRETCSEYRDEGYNACSSWESKCSDWLPWPFSYICNVVEWFCVAWYWVSNVVCVAWTYITEAVCIVWEFIETVVATVFEVVLATIGVIIAAIGFIVNLVFSIPIVGAFLKELWTLIVDVVWRIVGIVDFLGTLIGIRPEKKLRVCVMVLRDEKGNLVADKDMIVQEINRMIEIYSEEANVRVIQAKYFNLTTPFSDNEEASTDWIIELTKEESEGILDVNCGASAIGEDYWTQGTKFNWLMTTKCFWGNARRLLGYGCPIAVFVVRSIPGYSGCSLNVLSDYVCVVGTETEDKTTIAHECAHSCGLWDVDQPETNLMYGILSNVRHDLGSFQIAVLRDSKHVVYF